MKSCLWKQCRYEGEIYKLWNTLEVLKEKGSDIIDDQGSREIILSLWVKYLHKRLFDWFSQFLIPELSFINIPLIQTEFFMVRL